MPGRWSRRQLVQGAGAMGLALLAGCGRLPWQAPPKIARIGILIPYVADSRVSQELIQSFGAGLHEFGYVAGQNVILEYRFSHEQEERFPDLAAELVRLPVDVIVAEKHPAIRAAKQATSTIPVVMSAHADPVGAGVVASLARPGGNVTGLSSSAATLAGKRLELLQQVSPGISRVAFLRDNSSALAQRPSQRILEELEIAARVLGLGVLSLDVRAPADFAPAFEAALRERADALYVLGDPLTLNQRSRVADFIAENRLPAVFVEKSWVYAGGLMSYGPDYTALYRRAAYYVDRILKGARPADLPVEQPREFESVINLKTAQALGLTIPHHVLLQATEVIQ
jgi:putative tryptophan/tyrosine transport system substrate-binding protein